MLGLHGAHPSLANEAVTNVTGEENVWHKESYTERSVW